MLKQDVGQEQIDELCRPLERKWVQSVSVGRSGLMGGESQHPSRGRVIALVRGAALVSAGNEV